MTDAEVLAAIQKTHLKANIGGYESGKAKGRPRWDRAWLDPGGTIFGPGPYAKVPIDWDDCYGGIIVRVYAPERLRKRLAAKWSGLRPSGKGQEDGR